MSDAARTTNAASREVSVLKSRIETQLNRQRTLLERQAAFARDRIGRNAELRPSERQRMAENLETIIRAACAATDGARVTRSAIAAAAGMADARGRSSRFYEYTLDPEAPEEERRKRAARRLIKKPGGYLRLAEAAAKLGGLDPDRTVVDLVQGTRLAEGMDNLSDEVEPEHLVMLAAAVQGEARRIAEATGLAWYFRTIDEQGLSPTMDGWEADHEAFLWTYQAVPWVDLFTEEVAVFAGAWWPKRADGSFGEKVTKAVWVCRRVGLALAPFGKGKAVRAYFVRRPVLAVTDFPRRPADTGKPFSLADLDLSRAIVLGMPDPEGRVFARQGTLKVPEAVRSVAICPASDFPGDDHEFIEVTPGSIAAVLETGLPQASTVDGDALVVAAAAYTKSPPGSRTADLERALLHGQHYGDEGTRLTLRLERKASAAVNGLRAWIDARMAEIEDAMAHMAAANTR